MRHHGCGGGMECDEHGKGGCEGMKGCDDDDADSTSHHEMMHEKK
jgi:hypothetical protein